MLSQKTHFEQVPLELVRKLLDEQIGQESTLPYDPAIGPDPADEIPWGARDNSPAKVRALPVAEVKKL